ncbi:MAG: O-antigen ligase family protein [Candidatus Schekmanbacteria bacterium]|nr:O-antigen ligase family protein [Candidatus Schekmanbacteria bacterium]
MSGQAPQCAAAARTTAPWCARARAIAVTASFLCVLLEPPYGLAIIRSVAFGVACAAATYALWAERGQALPRHARDLVASVLAVVVVSLAGVGVSAQPAWSFRFWSHQLGEHIAIFLILLRFARPRDFYRFLVVLAVTVSALAVVGLVGYQTGTQVDVDRYTGPRASLMFHSYGRAALYIGRWAPLLVVLGALAPRPWLRILGLTGFGVCYLFTLFTFTRSIYVAVPFAVGLLFWWRRRGITVVVAAVFFLGLVSAPGFVGQRMRSFGDLLQSRHVSGERHLIWGSTLAMLRDHPALGIGYGWRNFELLYPQYRSPIATEKRLSNCHNLYLEIAVEAGLIGSLPNVWLGWCVLRRIRIVAEAVRRRTLRPPHEAIGLAALSSLFVFCVYSLTAVWFQSEGAADFWVCVAALDCVAAEVRGGGADEARAQRSD